MLWYQRIRCGVVCQEEAKCALYDKYDINVNSPRCYVRADRDRTSRRDTGRCDRRNRYVWRLDSSRRAMKATLGGGRSIRG